MCPRSGSAAVRRCPGPRSTATPVGATTRPGSSRPGPAPRCWWSTSRAGLVGHRRGRHRLGGAGPVEQRLLHQGGGPRRGEVADDRQHRAGRGDPGHVQRAELLGLDVLDGLRAGQVAAIGVVAVHPGEQRLPGHHAGGAAVDRQLLHEPVALPLDLPLGITGAGQQLPQQLEQPRQPGQQHRPAEAEPVRVGAGRQLPAERLQVDGDLRRRTTLGAREQRVGQQLGAGNVCVAAFAAGRGERDAQPDLGQRHSRATDGEHPQSVVEHRVADRGELGDPLPGEGGHGTGGGGRGGGTGGGGTGGAGHQAVSPAGRSSTTARLSRRSVAAAATTCSGVTAASSAGSSLSSSARPRCCS